METELQEVYSPSLEKKQIHSILTLLKESIDEATELRDKTLVDNPLLRNALTIVESFLRKKQRLCYGGMAINAHLPTSMKFYDFSKTLPDYDFFTPDPEKDIEDLISMFHKAGYTDVNARLGIHEGTTKLYVNFVGVADITSMPKWMYSILHKRALIDDGIYYVDSDYLKMSMYLELSRPRGEIERWDKVYKRLLLLNMAKNESNDSCSNTSSKKQIKLSKNLHEIMIHYIARNHLIFAGAELKRIYTNSKTNRVGYVLKSQSPVIVYALNPYYHIPIVRQLIHEEDPLATLKVVHWPSVTQGFPEMWGIQKNGDLVFLSIDVIYCNSYNVVKLPNALSMNIASLDTAITLFYMLTFVRGLDGIVPNSIQCFANSLVDISRKTRDRGLPGVYPLFVTNCHGHQESKESLLKAKLKRIKSLKKKQYKTSTKSSTKSSSKTAKKPRVN